MSHAHVACALLAANGCRAFELFKVRLFLGRQTFGTSRWMPAAAISGCRGRGSGHPLRGRTASLGLDRNDGCRWYNGYSRLGEGDAKVYGRFDNLVLSGTSPFKVHWFGTGSRKFLEVEGAA